MKETGNDRSTAAQGGNISGKRTSFRRSLFARSAILILSLSCFLLPLKVQSASTYSIKVTGMTFTGGIGRGPTSAYPDNISNYYRGYGLSGTMINLTASMSTDSDVTWTAPMYGAVVFKVTYGGGASDFFYVTIPSGSHTGSAAIPYTSTSMLAGQTTALTYTVTLYSGDYASSLTSSTSATIYWNNKNPMDSVFLSPPPTDINDVHITYTETSFTIAWRPVATSFALLHEDFYEYRIYYRKTGSTAYLQVNGTNDSVLRGLTNNPYPPTASDAARHFDAASRKYTTISNLQLATAYQYYIVAADIFGNETALTNAGTAAVPLAALTQPLKLTASITDGVTTYTDFSDILTAGLRPLRNVNTRVDIYTVTTQDQPDQCIVWFAPWTAAIAAAPTLPANAMVTGSMTANTAVLGANLDSVAAVRTGSNKWTAYLPTTPSSGKNQIVANGNSVRFVVQLYLKGASTFVDRDSSSTGNDADWYYTVGTATTTTPYPTRILNNVITSSNPRAYPSYYLTEDGYVTIQVYDIKGRPVATLLDSAFRRGGINIKEDGWDGSNKANRKVGVGLYYITFRAKSASSGKVILDDAKKVVMKH